MTEIPTPGELVERMIGAATALEAAQSELVDATRKAAASERLYRQARAQAWLTATEGTAKQKEDHVTSVTADRAYESHLAEGLKVAAVESVRNRRAILSAWQSVATAVRAEAELVRTYSGGP